MTDAADQFENARPKTPDKVRKQKEQEAKKADQTEKQHRDEIRDTLASSIGNEGAAVAIIYNGSLITGSVEALVEEPAILWRDNETGKQGIITLSHVEKAMIGSRSEDG